MSNKLCVTLYAKSELHNSENGKHAGAEMLGSSNPPGILPNMQHMKWWNNLQNALNQSKTRTDLHSKLWPWSVWLNKSAFTHEWHRHIGHNQSTVIYQNCSLGIKSGFCVATLWHINICRVPRSKLQPLNYVVDDRKAYYCAITHQQRGVKRLWHHVMYSKVSRSDDPMDYILSFLEMI